VSAAAIVSTRTGRGSPRQLSPTAARNIFLAVAALSVPCSLLEGVITHGDGPDILYALAFLVQPAALTALAGFALRQRPVLVVPVAALASVLGTALLILLVYLAARAGAFE